MADQETTFCTNFVNGYLRNATLHPQSRQPCTVISLMVDTRVNKMKSWDLQEVWEVHHYQHDNRKTFCAITGILKVLDFIQPNGALLHCRPLPLEQTPSTSVAFSFQERYTQPGKVRHSKLPLKTGLNVPQSTARFTVDFTCVRTSVFCVRQCVEEVLVC